MSIGSDRLVRLLALFALPLLIPLALAAGILQRPVRRTRPEVADMLEREANGEGSDAEWDDFSCLRIADVELEQIRVALVRAQEAGTLTPEVLRGYAGQLRRS